jgi:hypothetical protein
MVALDDPLPTTGKQGALGLQEFEHRWQAADIAKLCRHLHCPYLKTELECSSWAVLANAA